MNHTISALLKVFLKIRFMGKEMSLENYVNSHKDPTFIIIALKCLMGEKNA